MCWLYVTPTSSQQQTLSGQHSYRATSPTPGSCSWACAEMSARMYSTQVAVLFEQCLQLDESTRPTTCFPVPHTPRR